MRLSWGSAEMNMVCEPKSVCFRLATIDGSGTGKSSRSKLGVMHLKKKPTIIACILFLRETKALYKKPAILWSGGKDSTAILALCREAFFGTVPFPAIHIDNGIDFPETYRLRDQLRQEWGVDMKVAHSIIADDPISGISCCGQNKTDAIRKVLKEEGYDALIVGIRRDEHGVRAKERVFSPRDDMAVELERAAGRSLGLCT